MPLGNPIQKQNNTRIVSATATAGQVQFTVTGGYTINAISVYRNGVRLSNADDFTASDGSTVSLNVAADVGDSLDFHIFDKFTVSNAIVSAASTQAISGNLNVTGSLYATTFRPDDIVTDGNVSAGSLNVSGISTLGIATVSAIGLDLTGTANVTGVSTFKDDVVFTGANTNVTWDKSTDDLIFNDNAQAKFGTSGDLSIYHDSSHSYIKDSGTGNIYVDTNSLVVRNAAGNETLMQMSQDDAVYLYHNNSQKFQTTTSGISITNDLNVAGVSTFAGQLNASGDVSIADKIIHTGDTNTAIRFPSADTITAETSGSEALRIDSSGRLLLGTTAARSIADGTPNLQVEGTAGTASLGLVRNQNGAGGSNISFAKSRSGSLGGSTIVQDDDTLGNINFAGADGTDINTIAASIVASVDGTPGANDMPGRLVFNTTPDGSAIPIERLRIDSSGVLYLGPYKTATASLNVPYEIRVAPYGWSAAQDIAAISMGNHSGATGNDDGEIVFKTGKNVHSDANGLTEKVRIDSSGRLLVGHTAAYGSGKTQLFNTAQYVLDLSTWSADAHGPTIDFYKSRNATIGSSTVVQNGDVVGRLRFLGNDGANSRTAAQIDVEVDGAPGTNDMPGRLIFYTTADGASSPSERVRIDSSGRVMIGNDDAASMFSVANNLVVGSGSGSEGMTIFSDSTNDGIIAFADGTSDPAYRMGQIIYSHNSNNMQFRTNGNTNRLVINADGNSTFTGIVTATQFVPTEQRYGTKNLLINGAMQVAQRGTSHTGNGGFATLDRFYSTNQVINVDLITTQHALTSSDSGPWEEGFRYSLHQAQGYQGSVNANSYVTMGQRIEAQYIAQSGWNYLSSSSYLTLSFWVRSTTAQTYYGFLKTTDGTAKMYPFSWALSANTWTKITKNIPGDSNLQFDNNNSEGLELNISAYWGTDFTDAGTSLNTWANWSSSARTPVNTSTWFTTNGGSFEVTGIQLEVGLYATPFEHLSYGEELDLCQRYYYRWASGTSKYLAPGGYYSTGLFACVFSFPTTMRATPTLDYLTGTDRYLIYSNGGNDGVNAISYVRGHQNGGGFDITDGASGTLGAAGFLSTNNNDIHVSFTAEL